MRIGEISMNINTRACNYGSLLHSWAFQHYLMKYEGIEYVETINYIRRDMELWNRNFPAVEGLRKRQFRLFIRKLLEFPTYHSRLKKVDKFIHNNMNITSKVYTQSDFENDVLDYDVLVSDSDTIWAPRRNGKFDNGYFLNFINMENIKRISYAPSMGNAEIDELQKQELSKLLGNYSYISCRESYEKELLESCTNKSVTKVLDPVMLLTKADWEQLIEKNQANEVEKNYVLVYEPVDKSPILMECAKKYAEQHNMRIIIVSIDDKICFANKKKEVINNCSPERLLNLIANAGAVFTNSFHVICFSIIFEKDFYAFSRKDDKKVLDICTTFNLQDRFFQSIESYSESPIDYVQVNAVKEKEVLRSRKWLHDAIFEQEVSGSIV